MSRSRPLRPLDDLADRLDAAGVEAEDLRQLQDELDALERPPGRFARMSAAAKSSAGRHWQALVGELFESREAMHIVVARLQGQAISTEDRDKVRAQLVDLMKMFPAGVIAAANSAFPVPGTGLFTPWILCRLGLMPSRWREAYLLEQLGRQRDRLRAAGHAQSADQVEYLRQELEAGAEAREHVSRSAGLLTHWDANRNGRWDRDERAAYLREVHRVRALVERFGARKQWYLELENETYGALRWTELIADADVREHLDDDDLLVCFDGKTGWVAVPDVLGRDPVFA